MNNKQTASEPERKRVGLNLPVDLYLQARIAATIEDQPTQNWIADAIELKLNLEVWLFKNPEALALVMQGLSDAKQGRVSRVDLNDL